MQFKVGNYRDGSWESNIRMLTGTIKVDWIQLPVEPHLAALPTLQQGVSWGIQAEGCRSLGLGRRSCNSQCSSPMICLWRIGMQGCMAYQPFGLRLLCWVLTICAKLLAMIFISWGRSMMSEPCGGILTHNGDSYSVSSRRKDLAGTHLPSSRNDFSQISPSGQVMTRKRLCVLTEIL